MHRIRLAVAIGAALSLYSGAALALLPTTGAAWSGFSALDTAVQDWASAKGVKAITVAVVRDKKLVYEKGYGYQDSDQTQEILPDARMRLATNSVNLTKLALRRLIADGDLSENDFVVDVLGPDIGAPINGWGDQTRMEAIQIKHILNDTTCFSDGTGNADGSAIYANTYVGQNYWGPQDDIGRNATAAERIKWHWGQTTTMRPNCTVGTPMNPPKFSHYAYEVAGQILAMKAYDSSGFCNPNIIDTSVDDYAMCTWYWSAVYMTWHVADPIGATFYQALNSGTYVEEIWYDSAGYYGTWPSLGAEWDRNWTGVCSPYIDCQHVPVAYSIDFVARPGSGTIVTSARDLARVLSIYSPGPMTPRPTKLTDFGFTPQWSVGGGSLPGTTTLVLDRVINDTLGKHPVTAVILANKQVDSSTLQTAITTALDGMTEWPTFDLFEDTRIKNYWSNKYMQQVGSGSVTYAALNTSSLAQRWRLLKDSEGYTRLVNAGTSNGMVSNEHNYANAEYLAPHSSSLGSWWSQQWTLQDTGTAGTKRFNARWWNTHRLNVQNQTGSVEQSAVPDNYWSAWWSLEPVPSGAKTCSTSSTSPSCLCRYANSTTPCSCGTEACPAYWNAATCSPSHYNANDGCDCGCGGWDPDCDLPGQTLHCNGGSGTTCNRITLQCQ